MRVNTGGAIDPKEVVGRDKTIDLLWRVLERQSISLNAERRIGKTSLVRKMQAEPRAGFLLIYRDLEGISTPEEFVERLWEDVARYLPATLRVSGALSELFTRIGGTEIDGVLKLPKFAPGTWKSALESTLAGLDRAMEERVVFLWDELPYMLDKIRAVSGEPVAMEVLDALRAIRQDLPRLRMVFTGSIGLHHVLTALRDSGHTNAPVNDMSVETIGALRDADACNLALALLEGEKIATTDNEAVAARIAKSADGVPFYIHHLVEQLWRNDETATLDDVDAALTALLDDPQDRLQFAYYEARIESYYGPLAALAKAALDTLAVASEPLSFDETFRLVKLRIATEDAEALHRTLGLLTQDHYLSRVEGRFAFQFPLITRSWRLRRGL